MPNITNTSNLNLELCDESVTIASNEVQSKELDLTFTKTQSCQYFITGGTITYCIEIDNRSDVEFDSLRWFDVLDNRLTYVNNTFTANGAPKTPTINGQEISWSFATLHRHERITICFTAKVGPTSVGQ